MSWLTNTTLLCRGLARFLSEWSPPASIQSTAVRPFSPMTPIHSCSVYQGTLAKKLSRSLSASHTTRPVAVMRSGGIPPVFAPAEYPCVRDHHRKTAPSLPGPLTPCPSPPPLQALCCLVENATGCKSAPCSGARILSALPAPLSSGSRGRRRRYRFYCPGRQQGAAPSRTPSRLPRRLPLTQKPPQPRPARSAPRQPARLPLLRPYSTAPHPPTVSLRLTSVRVCPPALISSRKATR